MDALSGLVALGVLIIVAAFVAQPFFSPGSGEGGSGGRRAVSDARRRAELLQERNRLYAAIRDLDFDYKTNKVADDDYTAQRHTLMAEAVEVLQQLDALPADEEPAEVDPIEAAVAALRSGAPAVTPTTGQAATFCPQCGEPVAADDHFCGACGARL